MFLVVVGPTPREERERDPKSNKKKVLCNVPGCTVTPHANNLKKNHMSLTNKEMLERINKAVNIPSTYTGENTQ